MILTETYERQKLYAFAAEFLLARGAKNVLDMACGDGEGSSLLYQKIPSVTGVDISENLIQKAAGRFGSPALNFRVDDARKTSFPDASFDGVVSCHTLEHFSESDQVKFLSELKRITKPEAWLILATPDKEVWKIQGIAGIQEDHIRELTRYETEEMLRQAGFNIEKVLGQEVLKSRGILRRRILNFIKKADVLKLRRLFSDKFIAGVDEGTQPVTLTGEVLELKSGEKASINVFICTK